MRRLVGEPTANTLRSRLFAWRCQAMSSLSVRVPSGSPLTLFWLLEGLRKLGEVFQARKGEALALRLALTSGWLRRCDAGAAG